MNTTEQVELKIDYDELKSSIDKAVFRIGSQHKYGGFIYNYFPSRYTRNDQKEGCPAVFYKSSTDGIADFDIYIGINVIKVPFRRAVLLHETLEPALRAALGTQFDPNPAINFAHEIASRYDLRYARDTMNESVFQEYLGLREKLFMVEMKAMMPNRISFR